jgi:hypothetical protein
LLASDTEKELVRDARGGMVAEMEKKQTHYHISRDLRSKEK